MNDIYSSIKKVLIALINRKVFIERVKISKLDVDLAFILNIIIDKKIAKIKTCFLSSFVYKFK